VTRFILKLARLPISPLARGFGLGSIQPSDSIGNSVVREMLQLEIGFFRTGLQRIENSCKFRPESDYLGRQTIPDSGRM